MKKIYLLFITAYLLISITSFAQPTISSFSPTSGPIGTTVTITGTNFNSTAANNIVFFGATQATVTMASTDSLIVLVPNGATYQYISVTDITTGLTTYSYKPFLVTYTCGGTISPSSLATKIDYTTSNAPNSVAIGDLDGDGKSDIAVTNSTSNTVSVFRNTSTSATISFDAKVDFATGTAPQCVSIGDLNGDGKPDLVITAYSAAKISVLKNTSVVGAISFAAKVDYIAQIQPADISIGDINGDGKPDLAVANYYSNTVSIFKNTSVSGTISFALKVDFSTGTGPRGASLCDIDGDGKFDLATANYTANTVSVLKNTSTIGVISFAAKSDFAAGNTPGSISTADLDNDGKPDITVVNRSANTISILKNNSIIGSFSFSAKVSFATGTNPMCLSMNDIDGDGKPDISTANANTNSVSILTNTSAGGTISFATKIDFNVSTTPNFIAIGDIDLDGRPDIIAANQGSNTFSLLRNQNSDPKITSLTSATICNGDTVIIPISSNIPATYTWIANDNPNTTGESLTIQTGDTLLNTITNNTSVVQTVTYIITPTAISGTCMGLPTTVTITVNPTPEMTSINSTTISSNGLVIIPFTSNIPSTFTWIAADNPNTTGESTSLQTTSTLSNTIANNTSSTQIVSYTVTPMSTTGCGTGSPQNISVSVILPPTFTSFSPTSGPVGTTVTINGANFNTTASNNIVFFGATKATVIAASANSLTVIVPSGATYQYISVSDISTHLTTYSTSAFVVTYLCGGTIDINSLATKVDIATLTGPYPIAIGDLDGDGKADLVITNFINHLLSIYRNTSNGGVVSFAPKINYATGTSPIDISIGDLDGDGKPELIVANYGNASISIYKNTCAIGTISFGTGVAFTTGTNPCSVSIGDLNKDGKPDLAIANISSNTVSIFKNISVNGVISFVAKTDISTGASPSAVTIGDLDMDGKPDLAIANYNDSTASVFQNTSINGTISFAPKTDFIVGKNPGSISAGDLNADGFPELSVGNRSANTISILQNSSSTGSISFSPKVSFSSGANPKNISITDIDGDGQPDITSVNANSNTISLFKNTSISGTISFAPKTDFPVGTSPYSLTTGDLDGDGKPEIISTNYSSATISLLKNTTINPRIIAVSSAAICNGGILNIPLTSNLPCTFTWSAADNLNVTGESTSIQSGNALNDTLVNNSTTVQTITYTVNAIPISGTCSGLPFTITITVQPPLLITSSNSTTMPSGDLFSIPLTSNIPATFTWIASDNPNTIGESTALQTTSTLSNTITNNTDSTQIVYYTATPTSTVGCGSGSSQNISVSVGPGHISITSFYPTSGPVGTIVTITGSNFNPTPNNNIVFFGASQATVTNGNTNSLTVTVPSGTTYQDISVTDIYSNLTAYSSQPFVSTFSCPGTGMLYSGSFGARVDSISGNTPKGIISKDLDGDGKPDLATVNYGSNTVSIFRNTSTSDIISLSTKIDLVSGVNPYDLAVGDIDGDGKPDLIAVNYTSETFSVFRNTSTVGNISFASKVDFNTKNVPQRITLGDFNLDGKLDVVIANDNQSTLVKLVSIFRNTSTIGNISFSVPLDKGLNVQYIGVPFDLGVEDLDADGKPDIVVGNAGVFFFSVFRNTSPIGTVSFAARQDFATVGAPRGVAIGDLDNDGKPDVAVANDGQSKVSVFKNTSSVGVVSFATKVDYAATGVPDKVSIGDVDGDSKPELVVINKDSASISVYRNTCSTGVISFASKIDYPTVSAASKLAICDLNDDGRSDISLANYGSGKVTILKNIYCLKPVPVITSFLPISGPIGTLVTISGNNFDPNPANDIVFFGATQAHVFTATATSLTVEVPVGTTYQYISVTNLSTQLRANSNKPFIVTFPCGNGFNSNSFAPFVNVPSYGSVFGTNKIDIDGDGKLDLVYTSIGLDTLSILKNTSTIGAVSFAPRIRFYIGHSSICVTGDFDGDGKPDILNFRASNHVSVFRNTCSIGNISFGYSDIVLPLNGGGPKTGDFDGDGKLDIAVMYPNNQVTIFLNTSTTGVISFGIAKNYYVTYNQINDFQVNDLDGDGKDDIIVGCMDNILSILRNTSSFGNISFAQKIDLVTDYSANSIAIGDINNDGKPEIALLYKTTGIIAIFKNTSSVGTISFAPKLNFNTLADSYTVSIGDMDGDGKPDLVYDSYNNHVSVLKNYSTISNISFATLTGVNYITAGAVWGSLIADIDGDGKLDIITASGVVSVLRNTLTQNFVPLPFAEGFQDTTFIPTNWTLTNPNTNVTWAKSASAGGFGTSSASAFMDNYSSSSNISGQTDGMRTPKFDLSTSTSATLKFDIAYARNSPTKFDSLNVYVSTVSCGNPIWTKIYWKGGSSLATAPDQSSSIFVPTLSQWRTDSIDLAPYIGQTNVQFLFENKSGWGQALYIDNVNITNSIASATLSIAQTGGPNPGCSGSLNTYTATPSYGGATPIYQWKVNGSNVGTNSPIFSTSTLTNNDTIKCTMISSIVGVVNNPVTSNSIVVTVNPLPVAIITPSGPTNLCPGDSVTLTVNASNSYLWSTGATTQSIIVTTTQNDSVWITDFNGCSGKSSVTPVVVSAYLNAIITPSGPTTFCQGNPIVLASNSASNNHWSTNDTTQNITVNQSGNYTLVVNSSCGSDTSLTLSITVNPLPITPTITVSGPLCQGDSIVLTSSTANSYLWNNGATTQSINVVSTQTDSVKITDLNGCSATSLPISVVEHPNPIATISLSGSTTICQGDSVILTSSASNSYLWSNGATTQSIAAYTTQTDSVTVTSIYGCSATSSAIILTEHFLPVPSICNPPIAVCSNRPYLTGIQIQGGAPMVNLNPNLHDYTCNIQYHLVEDSTYRFLPFDNSIPNYFIAFIDANNDGIFTASEACPPNGQNVHNLGGQSYNNNVYLPMPSTPFENVPLRMRIFISTSFITVYDICNSLCGDYKDFTVFLTPSPIHTAFSTATPVVCSGGSATINFSNTTFGATSYFWDFGDGTTSTAVQPSHVYTGFGIYTVKLVAHNSIYSDSLIKTNYITINPIPSPTISITGNTTFCQGDSVILNASPTGTFLWSTGATTQSITVTSSQTDSVTVTVNGCSGTSSSIIVAVNLLPPIPTITASGATSLCQGDSVTLTSSVSYTYLWGNGATSQSITVTSSQNDSVTVTDLNGCKSTSSATIITIHALPVVVITPSGPITFCQGGNVTLDAGTGFTNYLWSNGNTSQNILVSATGNDSVTVTDVNSCSATSSAVVVLVNPLPPTPTITSNGSTNICQGDSVTLTSSIANSYSWSNGAITQSITITSSQNDSVTITDNNGCSAISSATSITILNDCNVWPGDANNDSLVNNFDLLPIGLYYSQTGPPRASISNAWQAYPIANWGTQQTNSSDIKHADCNGDGLIDNNDTLAININFSSIHAIVANNFNQEKTPNPDLYFVTGSNSYNAGDWIDAEVWAGNTTTPVGDLYGIAFNINYDASLVQPGTESLTYPINWLGTPGTNAITIAKTDAFATIAYGGITRINHSNASGYGKIADFKFQTKSNITSASVLYLTVSNYMANDANGTPVVFNTPADSISIIPLATGVVNTNTTAGFSIYPNPFNSQTTITFNEIQKNTTIKIIDVLGKEIKVINFTGKQLIIEKGEMQSGIYFVQVTDINKNVVNKRIVVQ